MSERTLADVAIEQANMKASSLAVRAVYTGRMLIKSSHENAIMPEPIDPIELYQYFSPELRPWARPLFRLLVRDSSNMALKRSLVIYDMAKNEPASIVIFDRNGKVA